MGSDTTATPELNKALAAVQANLPPVAKGETAEVKNKDTGKKMYEYQYAGLDAVSEAILPLLGKNGLAFTAWPTLDDGGRFVLHYALVHESGEERTGVYPLPSQGNPQVVGGAITYARRYALCAATGIAPGGDDNDAADVPEVHMDRARTTARPPADVPSRPTVPGPRTGPEQEQLRHGTVEGTPDDRPAQRTRSPVPDAENPWQNMDPADQPGFPDPADVQKIQIAYQGMNFARTDRQQVINISEQIIGRPLTGPKPGRTHNNLSFNEAVKLRDTLDSLQGDRGLLMERLTGIRQAAAAVGAQNATEGTQEGAGDD